MTTETKTQPTTDTPTQWPPLAHIRNTSSGPLQEGDKALCGAKLMGIDLEGMHAGRVCKECIELFRKLPPEKR